MENVVMEVSDAYSNWHFPNLLVIDLIALPILQHHLVVQHCLIIVLFEFVDLEQLPISP